MFASLRTQTFALSALVALGTVLASGAAIAEEFDSTNYFRQYDVRDRLRTSQQIMSENNAVLADLEGPYINEYPRRAASVSNDVAAQILRGVMNHPVASLNQLYKYDPEGGIGFCFGRAMTVHLESLYRGVSKSGIKKMWALGQLSDGGPTKWRYHVTSLLKGPGNTWYAIDPIFGRVMTARQWYNTMKQTFDRTDGKMKIYVTDAAKFGPSGGKYNTLGLTSPVYNDYFQDLVQSYKDNGYKPFSGPVLIQQGPGSRPQPLPGSEGGRRSQPVRRGGWGPGIRG